MREGLRVSGNSEATTVTLAISDQAIIEIADRGALANDD